MQYYQASAKYKPESDQALSGNPVEILEYFGNMTDPRVERTKEHLLTDIVVIAICAVISGANTWDQIEEFGQAKETWFRQFLHLPNGIPSHDTFNRVFSLLNPEEFQQSFIRWIEAISKLTKGEVVAIDGKQSRHSADRMTGKAALHMISAWATKNRLILAQRRVEDHSNEIPAIPDLLEMLEISGCIITIDAIGCQKEIAIAIIDKEADYVLALKQNQETLYNDVVASFVGLQVSSDPNRTLDFYETREQDHGRLETRRYWTTTTLDQLSTRDQWKSLQAIGKVESERHFNGKIEQQTRYFILSWPSDAKKFGEAVRAHWTIENSVHWVLDIAFREDESRIRNDHAPQNFAILRHIALNLLRQETSFKGSIQSKRLKSGWDDAFLAKIIKLRF